MCLYVTLFPAVIKNPLPFFFFSISLSPPQSFRHLTSSRPFSISLLSFFLLIGYWITSSIPYFIYLILENKVLLRLNSPVAINTHQQYPSYQTENRG